MATIAGRHANRRAPAPVPAVAECEPPGDTDWLNSMQESGDFTRPGEIFRQSRRPSVSVQTLIDEYAGGCAVLREAISGMTPEQIDAAPVPGKWSTRQIICHVADFEPVYADRMKRVIAEENPPLRGGDPDLFASRLAYGSRDIEEELQLIEAVRRHTARILRTLPDEAFQRTGEHSVDGPLTLETLLRRITGHVPHHARFIAEKRTALRA